MVRVKIEIFRFLLVGAVNFVLTFIVFTVLLKAIGLGYLVSLAGAWLVGVLFSYRLNFMWVFRPQADFQLKARFVKFLVASLGSLALNMLLLRYLVERTGADPLLVQSLLIPFIVALNFVAAKFWSLRQGGYG